MCGALFDSRSWEFVLSIYRDIAKVCPACGRRLYFTAGVRVFEVRDAA